MEDRKTEIRKAIEEGRTALGIELGSTRIKAVLIDETHSPVAAGSYQWENRLENGYWTYSMEDVWTGLQACYADLAADVERQYQTKLKTIGAAGVSAMMHGYLVFDQAGTLLTPFRTWRNTTARPAAARLTEQFQFNIPERWSIAHLYQAILDGEAHVPQIDYMTTLSGYIHWQLTGNRMLGIGDASGMFPIDSETGDFHAGMIRQFEALPECGGFLWKLKEILPEVKKAGEPAGRLTEAGARLLDPSGTLEAGIPFYPPEGDAGTGMAATNSVAVRTGNVSAGTSVFAMVVLEKALSAMHRELDMVTTPDGLPVAMVHANNCTSDLNAWVGLFGEFAKAAGMELSADQLYGLLYKKALEGDRDCGGLLSYGYYSGEFITGMEEGRPLFVRMPDASFTLANFMRSHLYTALGALKIGMDILMKEEHVELDNLLGHGGLFKTKGVGQRIMAAAVNTPVTVMETAGEGGPWGMALLAAYGRFADAGESLPDYLNRRVFKENQGSRMEPDPLDVKGFEQFMERYRRGLPVERAAVDCLPEA